MARVRAAGADAGGSGDGNGADITSEGDYCATSVTAASRPGYRGEAHPLTVTQLRVDKMT